LFELKLISRHASTVLVGQLAVMAFGVTDTLVAGRFAEASLAALSVGSAIYISVYVGLMGVLQALLPIWSELHGAKRHGLVGRSFRQALYLCAIGSVLGMAALLSPSSIFQITEVPQALRGEVERYLGILALALPCALLFRMFSTLNQGLGKPQLVTWLQIASLGLKVPLSIWFTFGGLGLAPQGVVGCAWATLIVNYLLVAVAIGLLKTQSFYQPYGIWRPLERPNWPTLRNFARFGVPSGLCIMVEVTSFTLMALFIARMGTSALASHQIAANLAAVLYMVPLSIGIAASSRVSFWIGSGSRDNAHKTLRTGLWMAVAAAVTLSTTLLIIRQPLAAAYTANQAVAHTAVELLGWVALYHLVDAVQAVSAFMLRCFGITMLPLLVYGFFLWGIGLAGGFTLAYRGLGDWPAHPSPVLFWASSTSALALTALIFLLLLFKTIRAGRQV